MTLFFNVRLPRILLALMVGCCLACAGAAYQGTFQNPLVSPDILGASQGAAFGAAVAILLGVSSFTTSLLAFGFSLFTVLLVLLISSRARGNHMMVVVLAGVMVSSLFQAGVSYAKLVAASVCVTGMIGWVGLVIPHLCRMLVGADYRRLIPASMLMGASFLLIVDDVARLATTAEIPIGILTAFVGAPFFLYLITRKKKL